MRKINFKVAFASLLLLGGMSLMSCSSSDDTPEVPDTPENPDKPDTPDTPDEPDVDPYDTPSEVKYKTFKGLAMCGYQGWQTAPGDSHNSRGWTHWQANGCGKFEPGYTTVEYWPDMSEYTKTYDTPFKYRDGTTATIYSASDYETVNLHFKWMKQYGIDGAIVQRFKSAVEATANGDTHSVKVFENCLKAAKENGVAVMLEYDMSGLRSTESDAVLKMISDDWNKLNATYHLTDPKECPQYVWEKGKPLVGFYAIGMNRQDKDAEGNGIENYATPAQYEKIFAGMEGRDNQLGEVSILAGTGYYWLLNKKDSPANNSDAQFFEDWEEFYKKLAVIAPWAVGRYSSKAGFANHEAQVKQEAQWCEENGVVYAPVSFPGFSWRNLQTSWNREGTEYTLDASNRYDACPRLRGKFLWYQMGNYKQWGANALFIAMFDEVDEGTAIYKCAHKDRTPWNYNEYNPQGKFLSYEDDIDTGYYMYLVGQAAKWMKGDKGDNNGYYNPNDPPVMSVVK